MRSPDSVGLPGSGKGSGYLEFDGEWNGGRLSPTSFVTYFIPNDWFVGTWIFTWRIKVLGDFNSRFQRDTCRHVNRPF